MKFQNMTDLVHKRLFDDIQIGEEIEQSVQISAEMVDQFIQLSGDISPIHVAETAAKARGTWPALAAACRRPGT